MPKAILTVALTALVFAGLGFVAGQRMSGDDAAVAADTPASRAPSTDPVALRDLVAATGISEDVHPIDEVADGPLPRIVDITHEAARLQFRSTVPLACSVVYGPTEAFGMAATDRDMDGAAMIDHDPVLAGLAPDTEYFYRVQGSGEDGTLYVGEVGSFRTAQAPPAPPPAASGAGAAAAGEDGDDVGAGGEGGETPLAGVGIAAVSSNYGGVANNQTWGAAKALDGDQRTEWSSNGDGDAAWIEGDFGGPARVGAVEVWSRTMSDGTAQIYSFTLRGDDGVVHGPFVLPDIHRAHRFAVDIDTTRLRLDVEDSSGGNTGLVELRVYGSRP